MTAAASLLPSPFGWKWRRTIALASSGVEEAVIALEILFARGTPIETVEPAIVESAAYWRQALESLGYVRSPYGYYENPA